MTSPTLETIIFDGYALAEQIEKQVAQNVTQLNRNIQVASIVFTEDSGGQLYTQLKQEAANRVGITYKPFPVSLEDPSQEIFDLISQLSEDDSIHGIIIQKPRRSIWQQVTLVDGDATSVRQAFKAWWQFLTSALALEKDIDGLHAETLASIEAGTWQDDGLAMPATAQAVLTIIEAENLIQNDKQPIVVLGRSDIVGQPLFYELRNQGLQVEMWGSKDFHQAVEQGRGLKKFDLIISATGAKRSVIGELIKPGVNIIDVGEPAPDVDANSVKGIASFLTPVPGGVGPLTVISLMENIVKLAQTSA